LLRRQWLSTAAAVLGGDRRRRTEVRRDRSSRAAVALKRAVEAVPAMNRRATAAFDPNASTTSRSD